MQRKRARSESDADSLRPPKKQKPAASPLPPQPLTRENLRRWEQLSNTSSEPATSPMPPSSASSTGPYDEDDRLHAYGIRVNSTAAFPQLLREHIDTVIKKQRESTRSPAAKNAARAQARAENANESTGIGIMVNNLLFCGEADGGEKYIERVSEALLNRKYLPPAPEPFIANQYGALTQPKPDTAMGYITTRDAQAGGVESPLSAGEEVVVLKDPLLTGLHFPFLTCQWKSAKGSQGHWHAQRQSARDGTAIVNYLHTFYTDAGVTPSVVDTCHWSLTCDMHSAVLCVHWRTEADGSAVYHMRRVQQEFLSAIEDEENTGIACLRHRLRSVLDYALGPRLTRIRDAIPRLKEAKTRKRTTRTPSTRSKPSQPLGDPECPPPSDPGYGGSLPPPSPTCSPEPKRARP